jgi:hypothetical protein
VPDSACATRTEVTGEPPFVQKCVRLLLPSLGDFLFVVMLVLLFWAPSQGWTQLLSDADTGWHIRTGEWILRAHAIPHSDLFSFSKPSAPWFAWEWLADVIFAGAFASQGLKGVVLLSGLLICASLLILFRYLLWRGAGIALAVFLTVFVADASRIHYLARPHVFTFVLLPVSLWLLDSDRRRRTKTVWLLAPLAALWANLHGGFAALFVCLGLWAGGSWVREWLGGRRRDALTGLRRHLLLTAACLLATLVNPYGWNLHAHLFRYLKSDWIVANVDEFQPPQMRSEGMYKFEALLLLGVALIPGFARRGRFEEAGLVGFWGHAALQSARHVPIFMLVAAPAAGSEIAALLEPHAAGWKPSSLLGTLRQLVADFSSSARRSSIWLPVLAAALWWMPAGPPWPSGFPARFPSKLIDANIAILAPAGKPAPRLLTPDEWGGYLIYRLYPATRVFIDGRSDFYGPEIGNDYLCLMRGCPRWSGIFERWRFDTALLPPAWPLAQLLAARPDWHVAGRDQSAILFQRTP